MAQQLCEQGFDRSRPAIVSWLGVTQYLSVEAIRSTLVTLGSLGPPIELVMTYALPALREHPAAEFFTPRAAVGEPWTTFFTPEDIARLVEQAGMTIIEDVAYAKDSIGSSLWQRSDALVPHELPRLVLATTAA